MCFRREQLLRRLRESVPVCQPVEESVEGHLVGEGGTSSMLAE